MPKLITLFTFCLLVLAGCGDNKKAPNANLTIPFQVHERLVVNVLSFKLISVSQELPKMRPAPEGKKYLAVRFILQHPGKNRGIPSITMPAVFEHAQIIHPKLAKPIILSLENLSPSLENYDEFIRGVSYEPIPSGSSKVVWAITTIPKDLTPPMLLDFVPKDNAKGVREMIVELK